MRRGMLRLWVVASVVWMAGASWHLYQRSEEAADSSLTISLNDETQLHIDAGGMRKQDKNEVKMQQAALVVLPPLLLLVVGFGGLWLVRGFRPDNG